ncbi:MAG: hypothetical protein K8S27_15765 [Candidatus Omnitrophica bacterium]|nr:hypothetical protein [Candidatus Omnitrophota bacterium]
MNRHLFFRGVVWFICGYNILLGIIFNCPQSVVVGFTRIVFQYDGTPGTALMFTIKLLGAYMIFFGAAMGLAAWNPVKNRAVLTVGSIFLVLRALQRAVQASQLESAFGITAQRNWVFIAMLMGFAIVVLAFRIKLYLEMKNPGQV